MGAEAACTLKRGGGRTEGKALLETDALIFRGAGVRLSIPYKEMSSVAAADGALRVDWPGGTATFEIGSAAPKWADKIRNPPSRIDKLGIKAGQRVLLVSVADTQLRADIEARGGEVVSGRLKAAPTYDRKAAPTYDRKAAPAYDVIFFAADDRAALDHLDPLRGRLKDDGALWIVRPKGSPAISEMDVMKAGKAAGLVDVKVVRFSDTHTAEKFVIPTVKRNVARGLQPPRRRSRAG